MWYVVSRMLINPSIFEKVKAANAQLVAVTKYLDATDTQMVFEKYKAHGLVCGFGENRTETLKEKGIPRAKTHYIGRLQSRKLPVIVEHCSVIHSLDNLKHAEIINTQAHQTECFIQVNVSGDPDKGGITPQELPLFLANVGKLPNLEIVGLSSMGWGEFEYDEKVQEFQTLVALRDQFLPNGLTSAGTSRDYQIALAQGIDVVRVGSDLFV